ncbi:hypothetical protein AA101099_2226 [Neoasaia chiangmaiensis NBRC 101099]|uniref:Uncharacterized protein n=1 Tax=Neoasaia chiangmaiensis TaxID=320497 RepID=A0A1U9KSK5_9PROT|nr:DUF1656 domain-containing protein [Neoasaia chiangmaiensis]AQS88821.1 hypothetical protein A0U93_13800 [Neoasaia chiangmaiensis]GBR40687.1 hypothetical protein AA101099_2226 [Neoasaia chiangmaiensis NBRC 101099]GEN13787.1 hypothetical protein NCH01_02180 [Neoasaia chiangmaiensis]
MRQVIDLDGVLVSAFVLNLAFALVTLALLRWVLGVLDCWRFVWNPPLAQFGLLVGLLGLYTLIF